MNIFMVDVRDENFFKLLPERLSGSNSQDGLIRVTAFPPLGIQTLAPVLRERGHRVRMFDTCHPQMKADNIALAAKEEKPDAIALSFLSATTYPAVKKLARRLKSEVPKIPIIVGGTFATMNADHILEDCADIDCVGAGEGEELLPDYLNNLENPDRVTGLVWRNGEKVIKNTPRPIIQDLDKFPYPDRTSLPIDYVESLPLDVPTVLSLDKFCTMQTSRGCYNKCIYCDIPSLSGGKLRFRSTAHVLGEMQQLNDMNYRSIYLTDDNFLLNTKRINEICSDIIERKLKFRWGCEGRVDAVAVNQLPIMSKANCKNMAFGVESGVQKVLDRLKKNQTLAQVEHAISEAKRHGIKSIHGFFLIGSPGESKKDIAQSFRFAARLKLDTFSFNRLCVYRGTPLWKEYVERGIINDKLDWHKWFKCSDIDPTVLPSKVLNRLRMKGYILLFLHRIFLRPIQSFNLLRTLCRYMKLSDVIRLLFSPFKRRSLSRKPEFTADMIKRFIKKGRSAISKLNVEYKDMTLKRRRDNERKT